MPKQLGVIAELRMLLAEFLVGMALWIAPKGHPDALRLAKALEGYVRNDEGKRP